MALSCTSGAVVGECDADAGESADAGPARAGAATVRDAIKQVAKLRPPGRYELLGHVRRKAKERHEALTAAAREMRLPRRDVEDDGGAGEDDQGGGTRDENVVSR